MLLFVCFILITIIIVNFKFITKQKYLLFIYLKYKK